MQDPSALGRWQAQGAGGNQAAVNAALSSVTPSPTSSASSSWGQGLGNLGVAPIDLLQALYPYATFQPTLDFEKQQQQARLASQLQIAELDAKSRLQAAQTQGEYTLAAQRLANIQAAKSQLFQGSFELARMLGTGRLTDTLQGLYWMAGKGAQPRPGSSFPGGLPNFSSWISGMEQAAQGDGGGVNIPALGSVGGGGTPIPPAPAYGNWPQSQIPGGGAPSQGGPSSLTDNPLFYGGPVRPTGLAGGGRVSAGNRGFGVLVGDGAGVRPGVTEVLVTRPNGSTEVIPLAGTAQHGMTGFGAYRPPSPQEIRQESGPGPWPLPQGRGDIKWPTPQGTGGDQGRINIRDYWQPGPVPRPKIQWPQPGPMPVPRPEPLPMGKGDVQWPQPQGPTSTGGGGDQGRITIPDDATLMNLAYRLGLGSPMGQLLFSLKRYAGGPYSGLTESVQSIQQALAAAGYNVAPEYYGYRAGPTGRVGPTGFAGGGLIDSDPDDDHLPFSAAPGTSQSPVGAMNWNINTLPVLQSIRSGQPLRQGGFGPVNLNEIGISDFPNPMQAASWWQRSGPAARLQAQDLWQAAGINPMTAQEMIYNFTPGFRWQQRPSFSLV